MAVEDFAPEPGRDLGPLIHALRRNGGTLTFVQWVSAPQSITVNLHLPDDEDQAGKCRPAIGQRERGVSEARHTQNDATYRWSGQEAVLAVPR